MLLMFVCTLSVIAFCFNSLSWESVYNSVSLLSLIFARFFRDEYRLRRGSGGNNCRLNLRWLSPGARF